jgi:hypothetical protein
VLLELAQREITFDDPATAVLRDAKERRQLVGLDFGLGGRVFGTFRLGHADFKLDNQAGTSFNGPVADVSVGYNFGGSGSRLTLIGGRDVRYTVFDPHPALRLLRGRAEARQILQPVHRRRARSGPSPARLLGRPSGPRGRQHHRNRRRAFRISENDLGRRVEYAFRYTRWIVNSTRDDLDQNRGTVGFGVSFGY